MAGTLTVGQLIPDVGTNLYLNTQQYGGNVVIGNATTSLVTFGGTGMAVTGTILGDFTNATVSSRTNFQTSTVNSSTGIYALPNGTSTAASWQATNAADPTNASKVLIATNGSTDVQLVSGRNGTGTYLPMSFYTNGVSQWQLNTSGNLVAQQSNIGIQFNKSGGLTNTVLNDYEEGTWTPTDASGAGLSLTVAAGTYTKVGNLVFLTFIAGYPTNASSSSATVGGFPFISGSNGGNSFGGFVTLTNSSLSFTPFMGNSSSQTVFRTTASVSITNTQLQGWYVRVSMLYQAA